jgi:hypothetical protein
VFRCNIALYHCSVISVVLKGSVWCCPKTIGVNLYFILFGENNIHFGSIKTGAERRDFLVCELLHTTAKATHCTIIMLSQ